MGESIERRRLWARSAKIRHRRPEGFELPIRFRVEIHEGRILDEERTRLSGDRVPLLAEFFHFANQVVALANERFNLFAMISFHGFETFVER